MTRFEFATATKILYGEGVFREAAPIASQMGRRALVVYGLKGEFIDTLTADLKALGMDCFTYEVVAEPTVDSIECGLRYAKEKACDVVLGLGGGSAIDTGKVIAVLATNPGVVLDYLEVIGNGMEIKVPALPLIAIPTTAGTGAEVTRNAVLGSPEHGVKVSLRSALMLPKVALVDPELTYQLPRDITAYTGLDALTQVIEPFASVSANPMTDALCRDGIRRAAHSLPKVYFDGKDKEARADMAIASLFGGLALANAKLGAVHGFAGPIGGMFPIPHGAICARLLPIVMDVNIRALRMRQPTALANQRYIEISMMVTGNAKAEAADGVRWVEELCAAMNIPALSNYGVTRESIPILVEMAARSSSMKGNPVHLAATEMQEILERALLPLSG